MCCLQECGVICIINLSKHAGIAVQACIQIHSDALMYPSCISVLVGPCSNSVQVPGSTLPWAAPEVLQSISARYLDPDGIYYIDGAAADVWSAVSVLYCVLTGALPFPVRSHVRAKERHVAARRAQESWVSSCCLGWLAFVCMWCTVLVHGTPSRHFHLIAANICPVALVEMARGVEAPCTA